MAGGGNTMHLIVFSPILLFGESLAACLDTFDDVHVGATCRSADAVPGCVRDLDPDLVLFDVTGEEALAEARGVAHACPTTRLIALAIPEVPKEVIACADAGFAAYVPRQASIDELRGVMRMAIRGEARCHPRLIGHLMSELHRRRGLEEPVELQPLTSRESEVLSLIGRGLSNKEVARALNLSVFTVKAHAHSIFAKLQVRGRGEAMARLRTMPWLGRPGRSHGPLQRSPEA